jgi:hypothetical protein
MPKRSVRPARSARARTAAILSATAAAGSPQVRYTSVWAAATGRAKGEEPPKYSGGTGSGSRASAASSTWM